MYGPHDIDEQECILEQELVSAPSSQMGPGWEQEMGEENQVKVKLGGGAPIGKGNGHLES